MPKHQHQPWDIKSFNLGANKDKDKDLLGASSKGEYVDANNMRPTEIDGDTFALDKIGGEEIKYPNLNNACGVATPYAPFPPTMDYQCMATEEINDRIVEVWADKNKVGDSFIRVDGKIVLMSPKFPISVDYPPQTAKNETCVGGEIYITDFHVPPMIFNIDDMIKNGGVDGNPCTPKYFLDFDLNNYSINLSRQQDHPVFVEMIDLTSPNPQYVIPNAIQETAGGTSMAVGMYQYAIRYGYTAGDVTVWSVNTPLIPVVDIMSAETPTYPSVRQVGVPPSPGIGRGYGIKIRFRVNNVLKYNKIEIRRVSYDAGDPLGTTHQAFLIHTIVDIEELPLGTVIDFLDRGAGGEEIITPDTDTEILSAIDSAKAIRYYNNRLYLMNIKYADRDISPSDIGIPKVDGHYTYPILHNMGKQGHHRIYNSAYYKSYKRSERYSFAMVFLDNLGQKSFAIPLDSNYQYPDRRDTVSATTLADVKAFGKGDSTDGNSTVKAADSVAGVSYTHEVFDMKQAIHKNNVVDFFNIMCITPNPLDINPGRNTNDCETYTTSYPSGFPTPPGTRVTVDEIGYKPLRPTGKTDTITNHDAVISTAVYQGSGGGWKKYSNQDASPVAGTNYFPKGFGPNYYSLGSAIKKINFNNIPWAQSAYVVRTKSAERIIAQGIGCYAFLEAGGIIGPNVCKDLSKFLFFSQDIAAGLVDAATITDMVDNPSSYQVEFVSPLGFFSEVYSGEGELIPNNDNSIDIVSYLRILYEDGSINLGDSNVGPQVIGNGGYVEFGRWRNYDQGTVGPSAMFNDNRNRELTGEKKVFDLSLVEYPVSLGTDSRQPMFRITTTYTGGLYEFYGSGGGANNDFEDAGLKNWHEPMYIINIIKKENIPDDGNVVEYYETGQYLKKESLIAKYDPTLDVAESQVIYLVDERWEDCISNVYAPIATRELQQRYIYIKETSNSVPKRWVDITYMDNTLIGNILLDIETNNSATYGIYGVYTHTNSNDEFYGIKIGRQGTVNGFDTSAWYITIPEAFIPVDQSLIYVNYDDNIPIKFFGGDTYLGESIFSPIDCKGEPTGGGSTNFKFDNGWPYNRFEVNPRLFTPNKVQPGVAIINRIQDSFRFRMKKIRQMAIMATVETKVATQYLTTNDSTGLGDSYNDKIFPQVHYVMRPNSYGATAENPTTTCPSTWPNVTYNLIQPAYTNDDYQEATLGDGTNHPSTDWLYGGIRLPYTIDFAFNIDYSKLPLTAKDFSKPKVGFNEETHFCTRVAWSEARAVNEIDAPGLKTFNPLSVYDISDDTGAIKYAFDCLSSKGRNLYAITDSGICLLLTDKQNVTDAAINQVALMSITSVVGVQDQFWLNKRVGMTDEMWRSGAEYDNALYFANLTSVYRLHNNAVEDIGNGYKVKIKSDLINNMKKGYGNALTGAYDIYHNEYWITIEYGESECTTFAYNVANKHWNGTYDYCFDKYLSFNTETYGMKGAETYTLDRGFLIDGSSIVSEVIQVTAPKQLFSKEFIRIRIASDVKPTEVQFSYDDFTNIAVLNLATQGNRYLLDYGAYEQYVPRANQTVNKYRLQGRKLLYKIVHSTEEEFRVVDVGVQYKLLK